MAKNKKRILFFAVGLVFLLSAFIFLELLFSSPASQLSATLRNKIIIAKLLNSSDFIVEHSPWSVVGGCKQSMNVKIYGADRPDQKGEMIITCRNDKQEQQHITTKHLSWVKVPVSLSRDFNQGQSFFLSVKKIDGDFKVVDFR